MLIDNPQMEDTYYGVTFAPLGEDGDRYLALGHVEPRRMVAAINRYARSYCSLPNLADDYSAKAADWLGCIQHKHAIFRAPDPDDYEDPDAIWYVDWSTPETPDARPVTVLEVA